MDSLLLFLTVTFCTLQNVLKKRFNKKCAAGNITFSAMISVFAALFFLFTTDDFSLTPEVLLFSAAFALSYGTAMLFSVLAIRCGSLAQSTLIISYSLLIPAFYGILFLNDKISAFTAAGLILLFVSLFLSYCEKSDIKITLKWLLFVLLAFTGSGMCSTVQKMEQVYCGSRYSNIFMIMALTITSVVFLAVSFIREGTSVVRNTLKKSWHLSALCGIMNGAVNMLVMLLNGRMAVSLIFPVISAGSIILTFLISLLFYRERFTLKQIAGFVTGISAVVLLNL